MDKKINKILINGNSSENDLLTLAHALKLKINYIGSIYNLKALNTGNYILLLSPSKKEFNGHWICLCIKKDKAYYFDSYGQGAPSIIEDNIKVPLYINKNQIQDMRSSHCGIYVIDFLYNMNKKGNPNTNFNNFIKSFHIY
jgi:hypothetical protein